jgi:PAS domain-containing protein
MALDSSGNITAANRSALALWAGQPGDLVGEAFADLFAFEVISRDPDWREAQWSALLESTLDESATLEIQPKQGASRRVHVRLERALGPSDGYLATVHAAGPAPSPEITVITAHSNCSPDRAPRDFST